MSNVKGYKDILAFHPGCYVEDYINELGISQIEFATRMGTTGKTISKLVNGQINLSNDLAKKLSVMTGISVESWLNLQTTYDRKLIEIEKLKEFDAQKEIASLIDYSYFVNYAGLPSTRDARERIANLCKFFTIADIRVLKEQDFLVNFRSKKGTFELKNEVNSRAWIQTALNMSRNIETKPYNSEKLKSYLPEIRNMTTMDPEVFLPRMKDIFAECGVAFVLLPHLKNSGVHGAVRWDNQDRVVLAMNNRDVNADIFWFSLFHEIKHVLQQKLKTVFVVSEELEFKNMDYELEKEADKFASEYLISSRYLNKIIGRKNISDEDILNFSNEIGIHPGIVVGRLQHEGKLPLNRGNQFKEKYVIV